MRREIVIGVPIAKAPRGKGPRTKKQVRRLKARMLAELEAEKQARLERLKAANVARRAL